MKTIACLLLVVLIMSCSDDDFENKNSIEYFQQRLNADMKYPAIKAVFGKPDGDIGSGIHIYVYNLDDGTRVMIGYTDSIMYANHVDQDNKLLEALI